ncbi:MAG: haloacid dehalogenase-like hydrolase [Clostridia bacterium]|nr:haloacid dehalogenase-like hydrolase [Clostridia bacterium]MBQ4609217.1 haloacid dehalogenase-like hydrolase [Clostridia bacterium]
MLIDVYDFDGTIYDGDSTADFVLFSLRRHPGVIAGLPRVAFAALRLLVRNIGLTQFKSVLFGEMSKRFSLEEEAELFWKDMNTRKKLGPWFFETPRDLPIVIASASPEFELRHAAKILGVDTLIGTKCDMKTGALTGKNCKGAEKISRIREVIGEYEVRAMYTDDAKADGPLLAIAREQYIVTHGSVTRRA